MTRVRTPSIQIRLTASFTAIFALAFLLVGLGVWLALNRSIEETTDRELHSRLADVRKYFDGFSADDLAHLQQEFQEEALLGQASANIRVFDAMGQLLFHTPETARWPAQSVSGVELPMRGRTTTIRVRHQLIRILTAPVRLGAVQIGLPVDEFEEVKTGFLWLSALGSPLVLMAAALGGYWMSGRALRPVESAFRRITEFTADASHELRTPVAIIQTTAELMQSRARTLDEHAEGWRRVSVETERTSRLISDLLTLARADAGKTEFDFQKTDLARVVDAAADEMRVLIEAKDLRLTVEGTSLPRWVKGDPDALRRVVCILLDNAIKFTPARGEIRVEVRGGGRAQVVVSDTGMGIGPQDLASVFERFYRVSKVRSQTGGTGLGLPIGQWIVREHGGEIDVSSAPGEGSTFTISLPSQVA